MPRLNPVTVTRPLDLPKREEKPAPPLIPHKGGASSLRDLTRDLGVGTCCGKCLPEAKAALSASLQARDSLRSALFSPASEFAV